MFARKKWFYCKNVRNNFIYFKLLIVFVLIQTHCVPQTNNAQTALTKTAPQSKKGLDYQSMIETLSARILKRFQSDRDSGKLERHHIFMTTASLQHNKLSQLDKMIIKDFKQSLENDNFIVKIPTSIANASHLTTTTCETRLATIFQDIKIILSSKPCNSQANCMLIILTIQYQRKTVSETCHLTLTPELDQKKKDIYQIPIHLGHLKKPFQNMEQSAKFIAENLHCMIHSLLPQEKSYRLLFGKTDTTPNFVVETIKENWGQLIGQDNIAKTIIPIDCYYDQFIIRDPKISESIPTDIPMLIAMDAIEIHPGKFRIRMNALSLKELTLSIEKNQLLPFGSCVPGCQFQVYSYTKSKGKSLVGEGFGSCNKDLPEKLWSYSAKILAERLAWQDLFNNIKNRLRKHYIAKDLSYLESALNEKTEIIMNNAILKWEKFDENTCQAQARLTIHDRFLPFKLYSE